MAPFNARRVKRAQYGVEVPGALRSLCVLGLACLAGGLSIPVFYAGNFRVSLMGPTLLALGCLSLALAGSLLLYSFVGKFRVRDRMLGMIRWQGDEAVLDVGTGRGLLAIGAAKRLKTGTVTGIDVWDLDGASGASLSAAQHNIGIENVEARIQLRGDDFWDIGFVDSSFDVVLSLACLHTVKTEESRAQVCHEISRLLRPRGLALIADYAHTGDYARRLAEAGLRVSGPKSLVFAAFTTLSIVVARKRG